MNPNNNSNSGNTGMFQNVVQLVLVLLLVVAAFFIGMLWTKVQGLPTATKDTGGTGTTAAGQPTQPTLANLEAIKGLFKKEVVKFGDANKKNLFVDVSDPSCPYCHIAGGKNPQLNTSAGDRFKLVADGGTYVAPVPEMRKLVEAGQAGYVFIYSPGHGNGEMGTRAMYCANEKGKYWAVHDLLMTNDGYNLLNNDVKNDKSKAQTLADFLKSAVDATFMKECLGSTKYDDRLKNDPAIAESIGVQGTPGFYVNDQNFAGAYSWTEMQSALKK